MTEDVLFSQEAQIGVITLNRPNALNALTLAMIEIMQEQLLAWKHDKTIHAVIIRAAEGGKAFCAGGDVRWLYHAGKQDLSEQMQFFWHEYRLNHFIYELGKPYIALMDGITMGGGVGISLHGSHPVGSERFVFAMPETAIGYFPDIGASHLLNLCPGYYGIYLALTGNRIGADDAKKLGLIKHTVASEQMPALYQALIANDLSTNAAYKVSAIIEQFESHAKPSQLSPLVDSCFSQPTVEMIELALKADYGDWAKEAVATLAKKSPLSLKITLEQMHKTKNLSLAECLKIDYDLDWHFMQGSDFYEGVRALLVEKDQNPQWQPSSLLLVDESVVKSYFEPASPRLQLL